jgi:diguanylate cyclase (GGDEF)-like protein/putative nucleotidyltransferase with HDIG domain
MGTAAGDRPARVGVPHLDNEQGPDRAGMARSLVYLLASGATITMFSLALPHDQHIDIRRSLMTAGCGYAMSALLLLGGRKLPMWGFQVMLASATMLVEWSIYASGDSTSPYTAFYFWIAIYAFHFFSRKAATLQIVFVCCAYAGVLAFITDASSVPVLRWAITTSALVVAGAMIGLLEERVRKLNAAVRIDTASGLMNRRGFHEIYDGDLERARRTNIELSLLICRLDNYKSRESENDPVFARVGDLLRASKRGMDRAARIGAEEFAVIVSNTDENGSYVLAERLRKEVREEFATDRTPITLSIGIATFPKHANTAEALMHAAEQGVNAAEQLGRDRAVIWSTEIASLVLAAESRRDGSRGGNLAAVLALTEVLDIRDAGTAMHSQTVGRYAEVIARELGLSDDLVERVRLAGILHDVGKIAVPDAILSKPSRLTDEEFAEMKKHPEVGALIIDGADLKDIAAWVLGHHERPDGRGYPRGLSDEEIPVEAKILAVADSYEAMTCDRVYRKAMPASDARAELRRCAGTQFDPHVVDVFVPYLEHEESLGRSVLPFTPEQIIGAPVAGAGGRSAA